MHRLGVEIVVGEHSKKKQKIGKKRENCYVDHAQNQNFESRRSVSGGVWEHLSIILVVLAGWGKLEFIVNCCCCWQRGERSLVVVVPSRLRRGEQKCERWTKTEPNWNRIFLLLPRPIPFSYSKKKLSHFPILYTLLFPQHKQITKQNGMFGHFCFSFIAALL